MISVSERFETFREEFRTTDMWKAMQLEHEGTPWHREANVATHTNMLIDWYKSNLYSSRSEGQRMFTLVACLMHDIGKPPAKIVKESEERGVYNAYHGHELLSSRMWVDYATSSASVRDLLLLDKDDIAFIALMLEHHVPFALKNDWKRRSLKAAFYTRMGETGHRAWVDLLLSDQHGRISDDQVTKLQAVDEWITEWDTLDWKSHLCGACDEGQLIPTSFTHEYAGKQIQFITNKCNNCGIEVISAEAAEKNRKKLEHYKERPK